VIGIDYHITLAPLASQEPASLDRAGGAKTGSQGAIGLEGGELTITARHWRSLLN
jgi:hypothetical protein